MHSDIFPFFEEVLKVTQSEVKKKDEALVSNAESRQVKSKFWIGLIDSHNGKITLLLLQNQISVLEIKIQNSLKHYK